ncbi:UNVERIFIED_CONTAM: uracil-DNA glycosylase, partial [Acinetobacter lwoffii]
MKVVILGQDPYHGPNQANGLSFSVQRGVALPPSLRNIFHELHTDLGVPVSRHGDLTKWAEQGVLLLNSVLTVEAGQPTSHQKQGWEEFTDAVIDVLNEQRELEVQVGDTVDVVVEALDNGMGQTVLSREKAKRAETCTKLEKIFEDGEIVTGVISGKV